MPQLDELNPINLSKAQPPIAFAAANVRFLSQFSDGTDELWSADIKACRHGTLCEVFEGILFVESSRSGTAPRTSSASSSRMATPRASTRRWPPSSRLSSRIGNTTA
jgi:hypothetical protein